MERRPGIQQKNFWEQPGLEKIIDGIRSVSPLLQEADNYQLFGLVKLAKDRVTSERRSNFDLGVDKLGAGEDKFNILDYLREIYLENPLLKDYLEAYSGYTQVNSDARGIPYFETYTYLMNSSENRAKFGIVKPEDSPYR